MPLVLIGIICVLFHQSPRLILCDNLILAAKLTFPRSLTFESWKGFINEPATARPMPCKGVRVLNYEPLDSIRSLVSRSLSLDF